MAEKQGVRIQALETMPRLEGEELFYFNACSLLSSAGYNDISAFCRDNYLNETERSDLIRILSTINKHRRKQESN